VSGQVIEVNSELIDHPELVNQDPFEKGWIMRVTMSDASEVDRLMSPEDYQTYIAGL
jgi:glycine cleavage system H protein